MSVCLSVTQFTDFCPRVGAGVTHLSLGALFEKQIFQVFKKSVLKLTFQGGARGMAGPRFFSTFLNNFDFTLTLRVLLGTLRDL